MNLRTLKFAEWQGQVQSAEYRAIAQTLAVRSAKPAPPGADTIVYARPDRGFPDDTTPGTHPTPPPTAPRTEPPSDQTHSSNTPAGWENAIPSWGFLALLGYVGLIVLIVAVGKTGGTG